MTPKQRTEAVLRGEIPDRVPVCLHNFLPAADEAGMQLEDHLNDPECAARAHIEAVEKYGYDCVLIDLDTTMLAEAMGATRDAAPNAPGHIAAPAIGDLSDISSLKVVDPEKDGRIPFSLAALLRGMEDFLMDLTDEDEHENAHRLLEICYRSHLAVHRAIRRAGAHLTSLGDSSCGPDVVSPAMFEQFARPYQERLVRELADDGTFTVIHICGDTSLILDSLADYPACGFELDYKTDAARAKGTVGANHVLFGNIDPSAVIANGTPGLIREACRQLIALWKPGGRFILNAGCAIPPGTPPENIRALVQAAREFGSYEI